MQHVIISPYMGQQQQICRHCTCGYRTQKPYDFNVTQSSMKANHCILISQNFPKIKQHSDYNFYFCSNFSRWRGYGSWESIRQAHTHTNTHSITKQKFCGAGNAFVVHMDLFLITSTSSLFMAPAISNKVYYLNKEKTSL